MTFGTTEDAETVRDVFADIGAFGPTDLGNAALYRGTGALVFLNAPITRGDRTRINIRLLAER